MEIMSKVSEDGNVKDFLVILSDDGLLYYS